MLSIPHILSKLFSFLFMHACALLTAVALAQPLIAQIHKKPTSHWLSLPSVWAFATCAPYLLLLVYWLILDPARLTACYHAARKTSFQAIIKKATEPFSVLPFIGVGLVFLLIFVSIHLTKTYLNGSFNY